MVNKLIDELLKDLIQVGNSPMVTKAMLLLICIGIYIVYIYLKAYLKRIYNEIKYNQDYVQAMDSALEHSLGNGYAVARDKKLEYLAKKEERLKR